MMPTWLLLLSIAGGGVTAAPFATREACEAARATAVQEFTIQPGHSVRAVCVPTGHAP
jgi:hypothetical protein